jgi:hypothetical protein
VSFFQGGETMSIKWEKWDKKEVEAVHGDIFFYRDLYEGEHASLFPRAKRLIEDGEVVDSLLHGNHVGKQVQTPYIVANVSRLIPEIPAMLVSRAVGSVKVVEEQTLEDADNLNEDEEATKIKKSEILKKIEDKSRLRFEHWTNIVQHQIDGGIVGTINYDENGIKIVTKARDIYYPHEDDMGCDLVYDRTIENQDGEMEEFVQIHREQVENNDQGRNQLVITEFLYRINEAGQLEEVEETEAKWLLGIDELVKVYPDRDRPFIVYWANDKTFKHPLGQSSLKNQEAKQDEINWVLTRNAIVYERNGKPRIAVSKEIMTALQEKAYERFGDESKIDHRDLEITTFDEQGKSMEVIQIDITKIGSIEWVKDLMKLMFIETKTSEKAVDFYLDNTGSPAQSGIAKFYDLFISIVKAERLLDEYIDFIQELYENALWLLKNDKYPELKIERPYIPQKDMIPISRKELVETNTQAYTNGIQSLERSVTNINYNEDEHIIEEELAMIESEKQTDDSTSLQMGRSNLQNMQDNRDEQGNPIEDEEQSTDPQATEGDS